MPSKRPRTRRFFARTQRTKRLHEQLEERVLFDAVPDMTAEMLAGAEADAFVPAIDASAEHAVNSATASEQQPQHAISEIVFVDKSVAGYEVLVADLVITHQAEVVFLDPDADGLSQIAERMQGLTGISAVHIISHGDSAELNLGTATLTAESITGEHADELAIISAAMTDEADLLIYGCSFGEGETGQAAAQALADVTGADVAASDDLTGNIALGGDWDLELRTGAVEAKVLSAQNFAGVLSVEATESIVTVQDAENSGAGTVSLTQNGSPLAVTTSGTPFRVGQMLERIWQYGETGDVGESTYVFDITGLSGLNGTKASEFGLIVSDTADLSGANTTTLVASGFDSTNNLIYFHGIDLSAGDYFGLATEVIADNFSVFPTASGLEDTSIDLGLTLNPALTDGGTLRDIFATAIGYRDSGAGTTPTEFLIPAGTTGIKITSYSTLDVGTSANDARNDDYQSLNVSIDLDAETSAGFIAHLVDQGPSRSDQFGWSDAPLGIPVLNGGTVTGDADDNINPTFSIVDGTLQIVENHGLQTAYHIDFLTNATSSAEFIETASDVRETNDQNSISLAIPTDADFIVLNIADAATASNDAHVENKGNSRIVIDLSTMTASGAVAAERGETDGRVVSYAFEDYDVSSAGVGSVLSSGATVVGDTQETEGLLNDSQIYVSGGNLIIDRNDTFATNFNSLVTAEFYERKNVGSSAELLGESTDYQFWNTATSIPTPVSQLLFDIPDNATLGILNLSLNGTNTNDTNENMGSGFAVIDLVNGTSSGTWYMVRASSIVDFVAWNDTDFDTVFFQDPNSISNHTTITQFNDRHAGNAEFKLNAAGDQLILESTSDRGDQSFLDYYAGGQIQWFGSAPFELTGFPVGGTFSSGSLNTTTGNWDLTIQDAINNGLAFIPDDHVSGNQPIDVSIRIGDEVDTTVVRIEAVIDPISFDVVDACGHEDTDIPIDANVTPTFVDQDGSETLTSIQLQNITIGHTISDGTNSFTATAGNQDVDITGWNRSAVTYRGLPDESGTFSVDMEVEWQDVGGGVTDTDSLTTSFDVTIKPVNDAPIAVNDNYLTLQGDPIVVTLADGLLLNDSDPDGDTLTTSVVSGTGPSNGSVMLNNDGTFTYTPNATFLGTDSFQYEVSDGNGGTAIATAFIDISPNVTGPLDAIDDTDTTNEETTVNIDVFNNDDLPTTGAFSITSTTAPANGSVTVLPNGTIDYTPNTDFFGTDTFTYTITDAIGRTDTATVTVTVNNTQDPPIATSDSGSTPEDTTLPNINILGNDSDPDGDPLTVTSASSPNGTIVINADGTIDYTPNMDFNGTDIVTYTISDGNGGTATSTVLINVVPVADPPTSADNAVTVAEDSEFVFSAGEFAFADGDPLDVLTTIRIDTLPADGQLLLAGVPVTPGQVISLGDLGAGRLVFRPDPDDFGNNYTTFDFSVSDGALYQTTPNTMTVHVTPEQDPPVATNNAITVAEESVGSPLGLAAPTDIDGDTLTATVTGLPTLGTVTLANGTPVNNGDTLTIAQLTGLLYDAPADFTVANAGTFTYDVSDGIDTDSGFVAITITPINDPPLIDLNGTNQAGNDHADVFTEGGVAVGITDADVDLSDVDDTDADSVEIKVGGLADGADEILNIGGTDFDLSSSNTITATVGGTSFQIAYDASTSTFTISESGGGTMPIADVEALLSTAAYRNDSPLPTTGMRTFDYCVTDPNGGISNVPTTEITVNRSQEFAEWAITGSSNVIDGNSAAYAVTLSAALRDGETAFVDLTLMDIDTNSSDYSAFSTAVANAVAAYSGPGTVAWVGSTLTFTSDGTGPMAPLNINVTTTPDGVYEGDEDFKVGLSNPGSTTGEVITLATADEVVTTIEDNDAPVTVSIGDGSAIEGSPVEFTISLDYSSFEDVVLDLSVTGGSATAGTDFETTNFEFFDGTTWVAATNGTEVTIPAGQTSLQVRVDSTAEGIVEADETFTLAATVLSGAVSDASDTGTGTIVNDDVPAISIDDVTVDEDNGTITFNVTLDQAPVTTAATVDWATSGGTATSGIDFTAATGSLTFNPGETSQTVVVTITDDNLFEQSETLNVDLSNAGNSTIADNQGIGTLIDDGTGPNGTDDDRPMLAVNDVTATEDVDTHAVFEITLSNPSTVPTVISLALNDVSATSGSDYGPTLEYFDGTAWQPLAGNLTIPPNTTLIQVRTAIIDDAIIDTGETFTLVATTVSGITSNASDTGIGTILDDPTPDDTTVEIAGPGSVTEGNSATYTVSIDNTPLTDVTVTFTYSGTASGGTDYAGIASVTIPAGSTTANFTVNTIDDLLGESLENFVVTIDSITGGSLENTVISATNNSVTTNIIDDDVPTISVTSVVVTEGFDPHAEFTVELSNATFEDIDISLSAVGSGSNPATGEVSGSTPFDFGTLGAADLEVFDGTSWNPLTATTIAAGTTSLRLRTAIVDDAFLDDLETFTVTATVTGGTTTNPAASGTGTILDEPTDPDVVLISLIGPPSVVEGSTTTNYTLTLTEFAAEDVVVTLGYSGTATDGSDYGSVATVTIAAGNNSGTFTLPTVNDSMFEGTEQIVITIDSVTGGGFEALNINPAANAVTTDIVDTADTPTISVNDVTAIEGTDNYAVYTIEVDNLSVEDIDVDLTLVNGTAIGGGVDFDSAGGGLEVFDGTAWVTATSATIAAGQYSVQVRVPIVDDVTDEPGENYTLEVDVTAGTTTNIQVIGTGTIIDDDAAPNVTIDDAIATEGDFLIFDVTLSNPSSQPIVLDFVATDTTATAATDYTASPIEYSTDGGTTWLPATNGTEVTIPADSTAVQVRIQTTEDTTLETTETMQLGIASVVSGIVGNTADTAVGTINDDDTALVSITANDPAAGEPTDNGQFTVSMTNPSDSPTVISYSIAGSAGNGTDFATISGSITLPAGTTSGLIDLTVIDDGIVESSEDVVLTLTAITSGDAAVSIDTTADTATATIADDDEATWQLAGDTNVNEGAVATYRLDLQGTLQSGESAAVDFGLTENSTSPADHATLVSALTTAVANYSGPGMLTLSGTTVTFTSDGTGAMAQLVIDIAATNDSIVEGVEDYDVTISNSASTTGAAVLIDPTASSVNTTIHDTIDAVGTSDDTANWSITGPAAADEGTTATYTISLDAGPGLGEVATVDLSLAAVDTNSSDYADFLLAVHAAAGPHPNVSFDGTTLTYIAPTDGAVMIDLVIDLGITNDTIIEGAEDFTLELSNPASSSGAAIGVDATADSVTTTINDTMTPGGAADGPGEWSITGDVSVDEGNSAAYTISLSGQFGAGEVSTIDISQTDIDTNSSDYALLTAAITAAVASDANVTFNAATGTLTYTAPTDGATMADIVVSLGTVNDVLIEGPEDYTLQLLNPTSSTGANVSVSATANEVTTTINDTVTPGGTADGPGEWSITGETTEDEGGIAQYTVALSGQFGAGEVVTVDLDLSDLTTNSTDYASIVVAITAAAAANPDVTFDGINSLTYTAPSDGATMADLVIDLGITDDTILEGAEQYTLSLSNPTTSTGAAIAVDAAASSVTTTINDTQNVGGSPDGPAEWSIFGQTWADEGGTYPWTIKLSGQFGLGDTATVVVDLVDITTNSSDYADIHAAISAAVASDPSLAYDSSTGTLTFTALTDGASMNDLTIQLDITDDAWTEGPETFSIGLTNAGSTTGLTTVGIEAANSIVITEINDTQGETQAADGPALWSITGDTAVDEGAIATYTISLTEQFGINETAEVTLALTDVDTNSGDYQAFATAVQNAIAGDSTLSFNAATGVLTFTSPFDGASLNDISLTLPITNDSFIEGPEDYSIGIASAGSTTGALVGLDVDTDVTTTINDTVSDGGGPDLAEWSLTGDVSVDEGGIASYTLALGGTLQAGEVATVDLSLSDIGTTSADYAAFAAAVQTAIGIRTDISFSAGTITYTGDGNPMADLVIDLSAIDDAFTEGPETYNVAISNSASTTGAAIGIDSASDNVTTLINDTQGIGGVADTSEWSITGDVSVDEGGTANYVVNLSGVLQAGENADVQLSLANIDTNSADYSALAAAVQTAIAGRTDLAFDSATGILSFTSSGAAMAPLTISIDAIDDSFIEGPERYQLLLNAPTSSTGAAIQLHATDNQVTTTIDDTIGNNGANETAEWSLGVDQTVAEGTPGSYTLALDGTLQAGEVVFVEVSLSDIDTTGSDYASINAAIQTAVNAYAGPGSVSFDSTTGIVSFTSDGTGPMSPLSISLGTIDDGFAEGVEDFLIRLTNAGSSTGAATSIDATASAAITTIDDTFGPGADDVAWSITGDATVDEGAAANYTIQLANGLQAGETATIDLSIGDLDTTLTDYASFTAAVNAAVASRPDLAFDSVTGTLTFTSQADGVPMADLVISLSAIDDAFVEGPEMYTIALSSPASTTGALTVLDSTQNIVATTINDTQGPAGNIDGPTEWSITGATTVAESATATYTINLAGNLQANETAIVQLTIADIETTSADYATFSSAVTAAVAAYNAGSDPGSLAWDGTNLTFTSDGTGPMGDMTLSLTSTNDAFVEGPERYRLDLANAFSTTGLSPTVSSTLGTVSTTITDDDVATWSITGPPEVAEGTSPNYTVNLAGIFQAGETVSVDISLTDNTTDPTDHANLVAQIAAAIVGNPNLTFNVTTGTLTYTAPTDGASMTPLVIGLPIADDAIVETPEDFTISLGNPATSTGATTAVDSSAPDVTTIINGDPHVQDDIHHTTVGTAVSGNVLTNDTDPDGDPLTVTPIPVTPPANGTLVLASNGTYTYTPNPGFRGIDSFEYEVCDDWGNCETAIATIMIADLSASKQQTLLVPNGDNFDVTFEVKVENTGSTRMDALTLFDNVSNQFGPTFLSIGNVSLDASGVTNGVAPTLNFNWAGNTSLDILDPSATGEFLLPGEWFTITYTVTMDPDATGTATSLTNQATVGGDDITTIAGDPLNVTDDSDSGSDPSTNNIAAPGDTGGEDDATPLHVPDLRVAKQQTGTPVQQADGSWNVDFELFVENTGTVDLTSPALFDDVSVQFLTAWHGSSNLAIDASGITFGGIAPGLNSAWIADPSANIFDGTGNLKPGESVKVSFTVNVDPDDLPAGLSTGLTNQATGSGVAVDASGNPITDANGDPITVSDLSDAGSNPNSTNANSPGDIGTSDDPTTLVLPEIGIAKRIIGSVPAAIGGNFNVTYEAVVRNTGTVDLGQLTLLEDIENQIGPGFVGVVGNPTIVSSTATTNPNINSNWDGNLDNAGDANMLDGISGLLQPGEQIVIQFTVEIDVDQITTSSHNQITAGASYDETPGSSGFEGTVSDLSDTGSDPSGSNTGQTGDTSSTNDPTLIPAVGLAKQHGTPVAAGPAGEEFSVPVTLVLQNLGPVELSNLNLVDDVQTQFGGTFVSVDSLAIDSSGVALGTSPGLNTSWIGNGANILDGTGNLQPGDVVIVTFNVVIDPDAGGTASALTNSASITASDANNPGLIVQDLSDSGVSPSSTNSGEPGDNSTADDPTPILIGDAGLAKQVTQISRNGIGFDLTVEFTLENTGTATLIDLQLHDDLMTQFGSHFGYVDGDPTIIASNASSNPTINTGYATDTSQNIFAAGGELQPGESITVRLIVHITPAATGATELSNQATGGGTPINPDGSPIPGGPIIDDSDSGSDPNGNNPGAPGDTGGTSDSTSTSLQFYSYDSFNNFSRGFGDSPGADDARHIILSKTISSLAPEPSFSGTARPGTRIVGRIYDSAGHVIAEEMSLADMGGNWMMVMHNTSSTDHHRIEFEELVGQGDAFGSYGDIYGYLGMDTHANRYASLEPLVAYDKRTHIGTVLQDSAHPSIETAHRTNNTPLGFGQQ